MKKICYVCGFQTEDALKHCTECGGILKEAEDKLTCSDCKHFTGKGCSVYPVEPPAFHQITGPPQCTAFEQKEPALSLKDIEDIQKLDTHSDDPTFLLNVPEANVHFYSQAAKVTKAGIRSTYATIKGQPYKKYPIRAIFLMHGPSKEEFLAEVRRQIKLNSPPPKKTFFDPDYAEIEKGMIEKQGIDPKDPYGKPSIEEQAKIEMEEALAEEASWEDYDYDYDYEDEYYKQEQGFLQNIDKKSRVAYQQAADNLNITIEFKKFATDKHGQRLPHMLEVYVPKEEEREKTKALYDEVKKVRKQIEATKPANPKMYTFSVTTEFDLDELVNSVKEAIDTPLLQFDCKLLDNGAYELLFTFQNKLSKIDFNLLALIAIKSGAKGSKTAKERKQNLDIITFGKGLKEGMENPDPVLDKIDVLSSETPDIFEASDEEISAGVEKTTMHWEGTYRFYWYEELGSKPTANTIQEKASQILTDTSNPLKKVEMFHVSNGALVDFTFHGPLSQKGYKELRDLAKIVHLHSKPYVGAKSFENPVWKVIKDSSESNKTLQEAFRFFWTKKPSKEPVVETLKEHFNKNISVPLSEIKQGSTNGLYYVEMVFTGPLSDTELNILQGSVKEWGLSLEAPKPKKKTYVMGNKSKEFIKGIMSLDEGGTTAIDLDPANLENISKLAEFYPPPIASKSKMLQKTINDKLLKANQNNDIIDWTLLNKSLAEGLKVPEHLLSQFMNIKKPPENIDPKEFEKLLTVTPEDAAWYEDASKQTNIFVRILPASTTKALYDIFIPKNELHRAAKLIEAVSNLKNAGKMQQALNQPPPTMIMGADWSDVEKTLASKGKKKRRRDCKPGQRKVKFKKTDEN